MLVASGEHPRPLASVIFDPKLCPWELKHYLKEEKSMIHSFTVPFGAKYLTGMVTSVPSYETFSLI
jgi:hypothetical protein